MEINGIPDAWDRHATLKDRTDKDCLAEIKHIAPRDQGDEKV